MKNIRKLLALVLALALVFALSACGSEPKGNVTSGGSDKTDVSGTTTPKEDKTEATPAPEAEPEDDIELGSMVGGTYENDFIGIGCKLDENWTYCTEDELLELNGLVADSVDDEELAEQLRDSKSFYDMMATAEDGLVSVNVVLENLGLIYGHTLDASGYIDVALETLEGSLAELGIEATSCEKVSFDFCGQPTDGIYITGSVQGVEMYQRMACVKAGNYMCCVTACTYVEDLTTDVLDLFYAK